MSEVRTREFAESALAFFIKNPLYYTQRRRDILQIPFEDKKIELVLAHLDKSHSDYKCFPTKAELQEQLKQELTDKAQCLDIDWMEYQEILTNIYSTETTQNTGQQINLYMADEHRNRIVARLQDAPLSELSKIAAEAERDLKYFQKIHYNEQKLGLNFMSREGINTLVKQVQAYSHGICMPCGIGPLDHALKGGSRKGELNCVLAATGQGKTTILINLTKGFVEQGYRVLHIYLDSLESETATRMTTCWLGEPTDEMSEEALGEALHRLLEENPRYANKLIPIQFPAKSISVDDVDEIIENVSLLYKEIDRQNGVYEEDCGVIDVVILDYFELLHYDGPEDSWRIDEAKAQRLNGVAVRRNVCIWEGTQGGTEAMKAEKLKAHMAHGHKDRFHPIANLLMVSCPEEDKMALRRYFSLDFGKSRRPLPFSSIPMILDVVTQRVYPDEDRLVKLQAVKPGAPEETADSISGKPAKSLKREELADALF